VTTRTLVRSATWNHDAPRRSLQERSVTTHAVVSGHTVDVYAEPLLADDGHGGLLQSVRVEVDNGLTPVLDPAVSTVAGTPVSWSGRPGPRGSLRLLVAAVDTPTPVVLTLAGLSDGPGIEVLLSPQRHWTIHLIHHSHLDIGYTDPQGTVLAEHLSFLDSCLDLTAATDTYPPESQFRWAVESLHSLRQWMRARPPQRVAELFDRVRQGRIELTAMPYNLHTETCSTDELFEMLRPARDLRDSHGVTFTTAMQTDVPGSTIGQVDALAQLGVRYLSVAHNWAGRSVPHLTGGQDLPRLFRWRAPSGNSVLVWMTDTPHGLAYMEGPLLGFDTSYADVEDLLPSYLTSLARNPYPFDGSVFGWPAADAPLTREPYPWDVLHLRVQGRFGDNAPPRLIMADTARQWNEQWAFPRLRLSRNEDFFTDAEHRLGDAIQTFDGDWTDWWAEGIGSGARPLAMTRRAQGAVADAQTVGSLAGILGAVDAAADTRDAAAPYEAASLFDEHTWGAGNPWTDGDHGHSSGDQQWHWKYGQAIAAHDGAVALLDRASARLGALLTAAPGALASFHVVNTQSWSRTDRVTCFLPESLVPQQIAVQVLDARTHRPVPLDVEPQLNPMHRAAGRFLLAVVSDVPPAGYVRLDVVPAPEPVTAPPAPTPAPAVTSDPPATDRQDPLVLDNGLLRVRVDLGAGSGTGTPGPARVASIRDLRSGRELVAADSTVGMASYVYDQYASAGEFNHKSSALEAGDSLALLGARTVAGPGVLIDRRSSATAETLVYSSFAAGARSLVTTLTLIRGVPRLDLTHRLSKAPTTAKESAYIAFPFATVEPTVRAEVTGGVVGTAIPAVPGGARHMRALRRWATFTDTNYTTAWSTQDAALVQFEMIALPYAPFPDSMSTREPATVYSWIHNNMWDTNFPSHQGFEMDFRYSIAGAPTSTLAAPEVLGVRTAAATSRPLHAVLARATAPGVPATPVEQSLFQISDDRIRLVGVTTLGERQILLRLQSVADEPVQVIVGVGCPLTAATAATWLGDPTGPADLLPSTAPLTHQIVVPVPTRGAVGLLLDLPPTTGS